MRHDTMANSTDLRVETVLETLHAAPGVFAYSLVRTAAPIRVDEALPRIPASVAEDDRQGFVDREGLDALRQGRAPADLPLLVATPEFLDSMREGGFHWLAERDFRPLQELRVPRPFDVLRSDPEAAGRIVRIDAGDHVLLDASGNPLPCAICFDAATQPVLDDDRYDLDALASALDGRPDIVPLDEDGHRHETPSVGANAGIHRIPWEDEPRRAISFLWIPTPEAYAEAWGAAADIAGSAVPGEVALRLRQAVIDLDILGIAGCRLDAARSPGR